MGIKLFDSEKDNNPIEYLRTKYNVPIFDFDEFDPDEMFIGANKKNFVRVKGSYLLTMYKNLKFKPNNYVTCVDDLIYSKDSSREIFSNASISCILKHVNDLRKDTQMKELVASRLANILGIKTEYVSIIAGTNDKYLAIDFLKKDETFENFKNYFDFMNKKSFYSFNGYNSCLDKFLDPMCIDILNNTKAGSQYEKAIKLKRFLIDFVKLYFFKKYIVHDSDVCSVNFGVVLSNDKKDISMAPGFDYERSFEPGIRSGQADGLEEDVKYLAEFYPSILRNVIKEMKITGSTFNQIKRVFDIYPFNANNSSDLYNLVNNSLLSLLGYTKIYLSSNGKRNNMELDN